MSYFWYYASRSIKNQLKKLFKSWVLIFLVVCMVVGIAVGIGITKHEDIAEKEPETQEQEEPEEEIEVDPELAIQIIEAIEGVLVIGIIALMAGGAEKNGAGMFLPADATLLFTSPVKPQSVLVFRTLSLIGTVIISFAYAGVNIPNMVRNLELPSITTFGFLYVLIITMIYAVLIRTYLYLVGSNNNRIRKAIVPSILGFFGAIAVAFVIYFRTCGLETGEAILSFFNAPFTRYIPIYGWIKYIPILMFHGKIGMAFLYIALTIAGVCGLIGLIYATKADYYEEAMAKAEETAQITRDLEDNASIVSIKGKPRKDKYRDGSFNKGFGANVYFEKAMYTRKKFATLGFFTKTSFTYLGVAIAVGIVCRFAADYANFMPTALALGVFCFYRSLGNPIERDTQSQYFVLIPETVTKKMFWSLLGSTTDCLLDLIPASLVETVLLGSNPLETLAWMLFIVSIDFYATTTGLFINLSVPQNAGKTIKQLVQIMFIYFGLLPDIALVAIGIATKNIIAYTALSIILNFVLALIFFAASQNFILPKDRKAETQNKFEKAELKLFKRDFSRVFFMPIMLAIVATIAQLIAVGIIGAFAPAWKNTVAYTWMMSFLPMYLVGLPLSTLVIRKVPVEKTKPLGKDLSIVEFLKCFTVGIFLMYAGNLVGTLLTLLASLFFGTDPSVQVQTLISGAPTIWTLIFVVILAPIVEELIFRKLMIDRIGKYGSALAIVSTGVAFGLYHGNISQGVYASVLGLLLGYIYIRTGKIKYSIGIHMCINFFGGIIAPFVASKVDVDVITSAITTGDYSLVFTQGNILYLIFIGVLAILFTIGFIVFLFGLRKITFKNQEYEIQKKKKFSVGFINWGMTALLIYFIYSTLVGFGVFEI